MKLRRPQEQHARRGIGNGEGGDGKKVAFQVWEVGSDCTILSMEASLGLRDLFQGGKLGFDCRRRGLKALHSPRLLWVVAQATKKRGANKLFLPLRAGAAAVSQKQ